MKDYFGRNSDSLKKKKLFLFDMDGTIYNDNTIFDGTLDLLDYIKSINGRYIFVSNNSSRSVSDYVKKVNNMGIEASEKEFYISTQATAKYIKENYGDILVFASGTTSFIEGLKSYGIRLTSEVNKEAKLILMGFDTELTFKKLENLIQMLNYKDIPYIATNPDIVCPVSFGFVPDCGSIAQILANATGRTPKFIGKPEPTMIEIAMKNEGFSKEETVVIGDRMYTDIASGKNAGVTTILVLSGEVTLQDYKKEKINIPDFVYQDVRTLVEDLKR